MNAFVKLIYKREILISCEKLEWVMLKHLLFSLLIVCFFVSSTSVEAGRKVTITVDVKQKKPDGRSWDPFGGAPDIQIKLFNNQIGNLVSPRLEDTYKTSYTFEIPDNVSEKINLEIWDMDIIENDLIGSCSFQNGRNQSFECGSSSVIINFIEGQKKIQTNTKNNEIAKNKNKQLNEIALSATDYGDSNWSDTQE
ncbi:MAG: hypothetical protein D4R68_07585, partial [Ignavibacteriales bacterium]